MDIILLHGDSRELSLELPDNSIDMVFTDPPYPKEFLGLFDWLGKESARILKPGGYLVTYTGQHWLPQVMNHLGSHLDYFWILANLHKGSTKILPARGAMNQWKPMLIYTKGKPNEHEVFMDCLSGKRSKFFHQWGQSEESALYYISIFSRIGDTIWEPFCGGGTTPYVCAQIERNCIAFEVDPLAYQVSQKRIEMVQKSLIPVENLQGELWKG